MSGYYFPKIAKMWQNDNVYKKLCNNLGIIGKFSSNSKRLE